MDVGCGTGILSMLAAKAGAQHVYAIEASGLAVKARENIVKNGFKDQITIIQGKVEDIELPVKYVDVIVSEWMGYMLLYESMLDSVLTARDRFLAPGGLMAPSQTRLVLTAITGERLWKEKIDFWNSVYGFDMSTMGTSYFDEGQIDINEASEVVTNEFIIKDVDAQTATVKSLDFKTPFTLTATTSTTVRAFLTHFDTFFNRDSKPTAEEVDIDQFKHDEYESPVSAVEKNISFTTGPRGQATHWKQVAFLLRTPIEVQKGDVIQGTFNCRKSKENSRELDVEIHYHIVSQGQGQEENKSNDQMATVGVYRVR